MARRKSWMGLTALPFIAAGLVFLYVGFTTDPLARTDDGYSLRWFWIVMGAWFIGLTIAVYLGIAFLLSRLGRRRGKTIDFGRRTMATIVSVRETGALEDKVRVDLELWVKPEGAQPYGTTHWELVRPSFLARLRKGDPIAVLVDPKDRNKLMIDWREPGV